MPATIQLLRWTVERASTEFDINPRTLSGRLKQHGILPGDDGKFSTLQILDAKFGDLEGERIRKMKAEADQIEMENAEASGRLLDVTDFTNSIAPAVVEMKRIIRSSKLSDEEQDLLLSQLSKLVSPVPPSLNIDQEQS